jgi:hypothetical protein
VPALLTEGGVIARCWNYHVFDPAVVKALDAVYVGLPDSVYRFGHDPGNEGEPPDPLQKVPGITVLPSRTYRWDGRLSADQWTSRMATYSDHQRLGQPQLAMLQSAVRGVFEDFGGSIDVHYGTLCLLAQRSSSAAGS